MRRKKGQAAMEFLMTYGWAILVVLAAIGALAYFGILSPDRWLPTKCTMTGGFSCLEHKVNASTNGEIYMRIQNNLGADTKTNWVFTFNSTDCNDYTTTVGTAIQNGDTYDFTFNCGTALSENQRVRGKMSIEYVKSQETQAHIATGELTTKAEI